MGKGTKSSSVREMNELAGLIAELKEEEALQRIGQYLDANLIPADKEQTN